MRNILLVFLAVATLQSCDKNRPIDCPSCIRAWIEVVKGDARWNPPAEVNEYYYNGKTVYLLSADCCDQYITLVDKSCNYICAPSGGFTGKGDMKCTDFTKKATFIRQVWKDAR